MLIFFFTKNCEVERKKEVFHQNTKGNDCSPPGLKYELNTFKRNVVVQASVFLNYFSSYRKIAMI